MSKPSQFITSSDFPTLKNDGNTGTTALPDVTVTVPASITIPGGSYLEYHTDVTIGSAGAITTARISSSKDSNVWYRAQFVVYTRFGADGFYSVGAFIHRINSTQIRCHAYIPNPNSTNTRGETTAETITFHLNTFIPPFA